MRSTLFQSLGPLTRSTLVRDGVAGITLAALAIPEVMGYTRISQTPVITGLYTLLLPVLAFAALGSSRHLVVGADSATAAILAATLIGAAAPYSPEYVGLTALTALVVAVMLLLAALFRLGFLADFLSRSALIGLLTGIGLQVAAGELGGLIGLPRQGSGAFEQVLSVFQRLSQANGPATLVAMSVFVVILVAKKWAPQLPGALIAVIGAVLASWMLDFQSHGIGVVGTVPSGLPNLSLPPLQGIRYDKIFAAAGSCFLVIIAQSAATSRAYAQRYQETFVENRDLIGLACANLGAGISGTFVVNGSPTKTEMVDAAGGRSQITHLTTGIVVLLVLLFLTGPLGLVPNVVLSTIVFLIGIKLIDVRGMAELYRLQRNEFVIAALTVLSVALVGVMEGIALAVILSLIDQVRHTYRARTCLWTPDPERPDGFHLQTVAIAPGVFAAPGILAYRFEANLFYANADHFKEEILALIQQNQPAIKGLVIDATGIDDIDYSAAKTLTQLRKELDGRALELAVVVTSQHLMHQLRRYGLESATTNFHTVKKAVRELSAGLEAVNPKLNLSEKPVV
ncbi:MULTISPECIES: SulP family inorganic anion transporter [unclassified Synechococcus]|uniref:SulP family inorganic anion transporter n=1 Tax=unclassified Synechococcus TaxID=2626047 RepID=UPI0020CE569F|nr:MULTISPECIES: SulP family inorganic anion transporter [unclassified Synechococcus]MCP9825269.1 SulP family inorganic anion transporter [Synechococcus sp. EJ6-Ellesmere]CAK6692846.1 putative sulfate transporter [Synechococcus sp. CBW1107]